MSSLKGDRAAQRKRRSIERTNQIKEREPRMEPNVRVKKINLNKLDEWLDDSEG